MFPAIKLAELEQFLLLLVFPCPRGCWPHGRDDGRTCESASELPLGAAQDVSTNQNQC